MWVPTQKTRSPGAFRSAVWERNAALASLPDAVIVLQNGFCESILLGTLHCVFTANWSSAFWRLSVHMKPLWKRLILYGNSCCLWCGMKCCQLKPEANFLDIVGPYLTTRTKIGMFWSEWQLYRNFLSLYADCTLFFTGQRRVKELEASLVRLVGFLSLLLQRSVALCQSEQLAERAWAAGRDSERPHVVAQQTKGMGRETTDPLRL